MGSNMAEQHPVGFQWVLEAKERGAKLIHVDPRFTRTSAMADVHLPIRSGTDIAFLGGIVNYIFEHDAWFREYVEHYTNGPVVIDPEFVDAEQDASGLFSGWRPQEGDYERDTWSYDGSDSETGSGRSERRAHVSGHQAHGAHGMNLQGGQPPVLDPSMEHERCVLQLLRRHFARYTPEKVAEVCGCRPEDMIRVAEALCENSGRERTSALVYSVGWTQHTTGVQNVRTASIVQLLLGNMGRPGGGILALRGHANIQGSTDIPTLYDILPGYIPMPHPRSPTLDSFVDQNGPDTGAWGNLRSYTVSLLKAWWGEAATPENDFCFNYVPRITGDHSHYTMMLRMLDGDVKGMLCVGQNPAVGSANSKLMRLALAKLDWLVVRDFQPIESATFWKDSPEHESGEARAEDIQTEVFFLPAAAHTEKDGSFTNTQRLLQWHHKACEAPDDCRSDLHWIYHLGTAVRRLLAESTLERDRPVLDLTWDYTLVGKYGEPDAAEILMEVSGRNVDGSFLNSYDELKDDGSTSCGSWIHSGVYANGVNQSARRRPGGDQNWIAQEWGWAWPKDTRIIYNRASADPAGRPWSERKRYVWWDAEQEKWTSLGDSPDFPPTKAPDYRPDPDAKGMDAISGDTPFILHPDGRGWLYATSGVIDGPFPVHYEPQESPVPNTLYDRQRNPTRQSFHRPENIYHPSNGAPGSDVFPFVLTTYRLTEHHTAGGMSRVVPYLAELQPEFFCEVSPALAAERGLEHGGWATIVTARQAVEARVLVTERLRPLTIGDPPRTTHVVGAPYHWGGVGIVTGDSANDLLPLVLDRNVHISEYKVATCDIQPGRRPRGPARLELVQDYRRRAGVAP